MKKKLFLIVFELSTISLMQTSAQLVATMDDLPLEVGSYWNGNDGSGGFTSGPVRFINQYNPDYFFWTGFAYSNITDVHSVGYSNQYSSIVGKGALESNNYAVGYTYGADTIAFNKPSDIFGLYVTNSTYAALSMQNGDEYSKKFGGETGNDQDWLKLTIRSWDNATDEIGKIDYYLADFRFSDNAKDYIITDWQWIDLNSFKNVSYLTFELSSSDNGDYGMNTPAYFCIDQVTVKDLTTIKFKVDDGKNPLEGVTVDLDGLKLTTGINGEVSFENVSPTVQMEVNASKEGYGTYNTKINGYFTSMYAITLLADKLEETSALETKIFPNPAQGQVLISSTSEINEIRIINIAGQAVMNVTGNEKFEQQILLDDLNDGIYMIQVSSSKGKTIQKIVKQ